MSDPSYNANIVHEQGGSVLRVKSGGSIVLDAGGTLDVTDGTFAGGGVSNTIENGQTVEFQSGSTLQVDSGATLTLPNGSLVTAELEAGAVTPAKMDFTGWKKISFTGHSGAGACTATGTAIGDRVIAVIGAPTAGGTLAVADPAFETTITVANQIQQSSASNLSSNTYIAFLIPAAA